LVARRVQQGDDLARFRMSSELRLLEDRLTIARNLEPPAARRLELDVGAGKDRAKLGRQTGGPGLVTSNRAILDLDLHVGVSRKRRSGKERGVTAQPDDSR
jgi:hypothetical protein